VYHRGFVYRGDKQSNLMRKFSYADYIVGKVWALTHDATTVTDNTFLVDTDLSIRSFGVDVNNEFDFTAFDEYIYQIVAK